MALTPPIAEILIATTETLRSALARLDQTGSGFLIATDESGRLAGVLTDGDMRRALLRGLVLDEFVTAAMRTNCVSLPVDASPADIQATLDQRIFFVPLVDALGRPVDYASHQRPRRLPVMEPELNGNEAAYLDECVRSGWISSQGRFVRLFERILAEYHDLPHALAVCNGTAALHLALVSLGVGPGDEVIVPDFTFAATASAVVHAGAVPVFVDVDPATWNLDVGALERSLTSNTRAVIPVHLYGRPCEMDRLQEVAARHQLLIVEDCAEAFGARYNGRRIGSFGDASCFSFFGNKTITTGEGGAVLFRNDAVAERARRLRDHGMEATRRYWHPEVGYNYRMTNMQAAIGVAQMERVEHILDRKRAISAAYDAALSGIRGVELPHEVPNGESVCWLYTIKVSEPCGLTRDELSQRLLSNGIETRPVFWPLHEMPAFAPFTRLTDFPVTQGISLGGLSLPSATSMTQHELEFVSATIRDVVAIRNLAIESR
jgi:perosamine synthetase